MVFDSKVKSKPIFVPRLLELSNDIEKNPGPPKIIKNGLIPPGPANGKDKSKMSEKADKNGSAPKVVANVDDGLTPTGPTDLETLRGIVERQAEVIRSQKTEIEGMRKQMEKNLQLTQDFQSEMSEIRKNWQTICEVKKPEDNQAGIASKLEALATAYNDIQDRLYEIDKSWKNNLMIYGVPCAENIEEDPIITEEKVKEVLGKKLYITREIPMSRVSRITYGPDFRGHKPIQVCLVNYRDKEEILRKARLLKGSNIYISEDFSRKVREHRNELIKFMKEVKSRDPARRMVLRYDKLYVGNDVFFFNDRTGRVERLHQPLEGGVPASTSLGNLILNESQATYHDSTWLRRPRSRIGSRPGSRCGTPLSRQNSMSMEDFTNADSSHHLPRMTNTRVASSARVRRPQPNSPRKSFSTDSLRQYDNGSMNDNQHHYQQQQQQQQQQYHNGSHQNHNYAQHQRRSSNDAYNNHVADTPIPSPQPSHHQQQQYQLEKQIQQYSHRNQPAYTSDSEDELMSIDRRILTDHTMRPYTNGGYDSDRPQPGSNPGSPSKRVAFRDSPPQVHAINHVSPPRIDDDEMLAIETEIRPKTSTNSFPVIPVGNNSLALPDPTPPSGGTRALVRSAPATEHPLPPIDYVSNPVAVQLPMAMANTKGYVFQHNYPTFEALKAQHGLPALGSPTPPSVVSVQPYGNGDAESDEDLDDDDGQLGLEYQQPTNGGGKSNGSRRRKFAPTSHQSQGGVVKVAMIGEFSMSNFHQCN